MPLCAWQKNFNIGYFLQTVEVRSFKFCWMMINLNAGLHFHIGFNYFDVFKVTKMLGQKKR